MSDKPMMGATEMQSAGVPADLVPGVQKAVEAGFDFSVILQIILRALADPELLALIRKLFGG